MASGPPSRRRCLTGVPVHLVLATQLAPERLRAAPPSVHLAGVTLRSSVASSTQPAQPPAGLVPALAGWAPTLTAVHGLPLMELLDGPQPGLAGFSRLRSLALLQMRDDIESDAELEWEMPPPLPAALLPPSLEELALSYGDLPHGNHGPLQEQVPSRLVGFNALPCLRTITFAGFSVWPLGRWHIDSDEDDDEDEDGDDVAKMPDHVQFPESLEVPSATRLSSSTHVSARVSRGETREAIARRRRLVCALHKQYSHNARNASDVVVCAHGCRLCVLRLR